eukprot:9143272-Alexandrium_andersonii.AAC.1
MQAGEAVGNSAVAASPEVSCRGGSGYPARCRQYARERCAFGSAQTQAMASCPAQYLHSARQ